MGSTQQSEQSWFRRTWNKLTADQSEIDAAELRAQSAGLGATQVRLCPAGGKVRVAGTVRTLMVSRSGTPRLEVGIFDGSGTMTAVFLGRREVAGIALDRRVVLTGRMTLVDDRPTIFNPAYELRRAA